MGETMANGDTYSVDARGPKGSFIVDGRGVVLAFDLRMEELTGWPAFEVVGRHKDQAGGREGSENGTGVVVRSLYEGAIPTPMPQDGFDLRLRCRDGRLLDVEAFAKPLRGAGGRMSVNVARVLALSEIPGLTLGSERRDRLTGLEDQGAFQARLELEVAQADAHARPLALILADVDHLRRINDRLGRSAGDELLRKLAGILRAAVGEDDMVARLSDDDFGILLVGSGRGEARQVAARIRSNMEQVRLLCGRVGQDAGRLVTLSLGAATYPADAESAADLLERTREALSEARALGRNRVWCYARRARIPVKTPVYFDGTEPSIVGFSTDLSPSGIFIRTPAPLDAGMRCALAFPLPGTEENVHVIGRVVRSVTHIDPDSQTDPEPSTGMGIEFEKFGPEDRLTIETFLHNVMTRTPARKSAD